MVSGTTSNIDQIKLDNLKRIITDKKLIEETIKQGKPLSDLKAKGIKFAKPI
jgi:hypothetical protein